MATAQEYADVLYDSAVQRLQLGGAIADVSRVGQSVFFNGRRPMNLLIVKRDATDVQALVSDLDVKVIVLGGRPGIPVGKELFTIAIAGQPPEDLANGVLDRIGQYLAASTS